MISPRLIAGEKFVALLAVAAVAGTTIWCGQQQERVHRLRAERVAANLAGAAYVSATLPEIPAVPKPWGRPSAQSSGADWVYELFTPPAIYYHAAARTFTVRPPTDAAERSERPFGLELLAVKREPFRLQLVGYVGGPGDYLAAFVSEQTPETLFARAGKRFDRLGLALKSVEVRRLNRAARAPQPVDEIAAVATLRDERTGEEVVLDTRGPKLTETPLAVLRFVADAKGKPRIVHQGDIFRQDDAVFRVERIELNPPEVLVAKTTADSPYPETRVLKPAASGQRADAAVAAARFGTAPSPAVATTARP